MQRTALEAFLEVVEAGSIQAAARASGRSRATYQRHIQALRGALDAPELLARGPGQRQVELSPAGRALERRARAILARWDRWEVETRHAVSAARDEVRVGALAGAFDLLSDLVAELEGRTVLVEYPAGELPGAVASGAVDLAVGIAVPEGVPRRVVFSEVGPLPWSVILPAARAPEFDAQIRLADLHEVPLVVPRTGPARDLLDRCFESHPEGPLTLVAAAEVESTPRMVELVAKGFGPAIVTQFRTRYLPDQGVAVRPLLDGPAPLIAGLYARDAGARPVGAEGLVARIEAALGDVVRAPR